MIIKSKSGVACQEAIPVPKYDVGTSCLHEGRCLAPLLPEYGRIMRPCFDNIAFNKLSSDQTAKSFHGVPSPQNRSRSSSEFPNLNIRVQ